MKKDELFKDTKQLLLDALSKENGVVIALAYSYAKNFDKYGVDINALWDNQAQNLQALERAYTEGYFDGLMQAGDDKNRGKEKGKWIYEPNCWLRCSCCGSHYPHTSICEVKGSNYCPNCGAEMESEVEDD